MTSQSVIASRPARGSGQATTTTTTTGGGQRGGTFLSSTRRGCEGCRQNPPAAAPSKLSGGENMMTSSLCYPGSRGLSFVF